MREKGLRITPQREAILDYLLSTGEHPSARRIWEAVRERIPTISLSTVYHSLSELSKFNIIKTLEFNELENRYEGNFSHHINLICLRCHKIIDYPTTHTIDMDQVEDQTRFKPFRSRFELYGVCEDCSEP